MSTGWNMPDGYDECAGCGIPMSTIGGARYCRECEPPRDDKGRFVKRPYVSEMAIMQRRIGEWADEAFPASTPSSVVRHLGRERDELSAAVFNATACWREPGDLSSVREEAADCLLLLLHLAHKMGFSLEEAAWAKHDVNVRRHWGVPDAEGVVEHVR